MVRTVCFLIFLGFVSCQKDEELSKARIFWGTWEVAETKRIFDNDLGMTDTLIYRDFEIVFNELNKGYFKESINQQFIWAAQDDPNILIISSVLNAFDPDNEPKFYSTKVYSINDIEMDQIMLHNEEVIVNDSTNITIEKFWNMQRIN
ncbi:MAG TPA: hypothetical protein VFG10_11715 [Saprospiraceae bacterium]|nr:hypothetical protein [Saprospiraceae bacterium]